MILSAIYIENHFLFEKPQIINFGGRYFFSINEKGFITKEDNKNFIPNFYNQDTVLLLSAIVGKNGAGKSSLLEIISNSLNSEYGYISTIFFEDNDKILVSSKSNAKFTFHIENHTTNNTISTFYYSPFLDFKSRRSGIDLSFDFLMQKDLEDIDTKRKSNSKIEPLQQLKMKNEIRQMNFKNSEIGKEFCKIFNLPSDNLNKITFTRYLIEVDREKDEIRFHNTPYGFRNFIQYIYKKTRQEANDIDKRRVGEFQKELLKNYFLMDFICLFIIQMEKENRFLEEGFLDIDINKFSDKFKNESAQNSFFFFLENHFYKIQNGKKFTLLPISETKDLILKVNEFIDQANVNDKIKFIEFDWSEKAIFLEQNKAIELLELQNTFLNKVNSYYQKNIENFTDFKFTKEDKIEDFINFLPSERALSSGENALLNLFSRFHESLEELTFFKWMNNINIVLLDEADLGFHPKWKKQFVKSILFFFDIYFKSLKSNVQIIFTTHDPLTLSDVLNYNTIYLDKENSNVVFDQYTKPKNSFGANISDLLSDSFFIGDGLIGEFAKSKIQDVIEYLNDKNKRVEKKWISSPEVAKKVIDQIGEPYLNEKLNDMFLEAFPEFKNDEILKLEEKLKQLKK
ncbi:AAA family ATPase [Flavobacterium sp.]|uniref:AAA family ATPase n=1 Tax=Flavobacterium sp. TaxID=239 RepID=UPI002FDC7AF1